MQLGTFSYRWNDDVMRKLRRMVGSRGHRTFPQKTALHVWPPEHLSSGACQCEWSSFKLGSGAPLCSHPLLTTLVNGLGDQITICLGGRSHFYLVLSTLQPIVQDASWNQVETRSMCILPITMIVLLSQPSCFVLQHNQTVNLEYLVSMTSKSPCASCCYSATSKDAWCRRGAVFTDGDMGCMRG